VEEVKSVPVEPPSKLLSKGERFLRHLNNSS